MTEGTPPARPASYDKKVGLVLQGGGALGSYQAGVYEALASSEYTPDWVAGISIGAINAAIIAGRGRPATAAAVRGQRPLGNHPQAQGTDRQHRSRR
jgi:predicted acylesterase/phospholipase RssA